MTESPKREDILQTVANHALTDVLYDSLAQFVVSDSGATFRVRAQYYSTKYGSLQITEDEIEFIVKAICDVNTADITIEAKIRFLKAIPK